MIPNRRKHSGCETRVSCDTSWRGARSECDKRVGVSRCVWRSCGVWMGWPRGCGWQRTGGKRRSGGRIKRWYRLRRSGQPVSPSVVASSSVAAGCTESGQLMCPIGVVATVCVAVRQDRGTLTQEYGSSTVLPFVRLAVLLSAVTCRYAEI
eukprot:2961584-Rhodomonas_salina.3